MNDANTITTWHVQSFRAKTLGASQFPQNKADWLSSLSWRRYASAMLLLQFRGSGPNCQIVAEAFRFI